MQRYAERSVFISIDSLLAIGHMNDFPSLIPLYQYKENSSGVFPSSKKLNNLYSLSAYTPFTIHAITEERSFLARTS
jgi:hypothetical protein